MRFGILTTHPIQYQVPLFKRLAETPGVDFTAYFCCDHGLRPSFDPGFGKTIQFDVPLTEGYGHRFLRNVAPNPGVRTSGMLNPSVGIETRDLDVLVITGYAHTATWLRTFWPRLGQRKPRLLFRGENHLNEARPAWKTLAKQAPIRAFFSRFDRFLAIGTLNRDYLMHYGAPENRIVIAPYSVDNDYFRERSMVRSREEVRSAHGIPLDRVAFLTCSKLSDVKRPLDAVRAFAKARKEAPCSLVMVGTGILEQPIRAEISRLGLEKDVFLLGFQNQSELPSIYAACDALVLPSDIEPWGLVVNEAMACGIPAVVSDRVGSGPDLVAGTGEIFPVGDVNRLAAIMTKYAKVPKELAQAKTRARSRIGEWGIAETASAYLDAARAALRDT